MPKFMRSEQVERQQEHLKQKHVDSGGAAMTPRKMRKPDPPRAKMKPYEKRVDEAQFRPTKKLRKK